MKLHKSLAEACTQAIFNIMVENRHANRTIENLLKSNKKWGARDRSFIAEHCWEMIRWWRLILECTNCDTKNITHNECYTLLATWLIIKPLHLENKTETAIPNWVEFEKIDSDNIKQKYFSVKSERKIIHSIPDWLDEIGENEIGKNWNEILTSLNTTAPLDIRINTLKGNKNEIIKALEDNEIQTFETEKDALRLSKKINIHRHPLYLAGHFEVQDLGSQKIAQFLNPQPGEIVIDGCAGAGGKALHMATIMQNKGKITAMDIENFKLIELQKRAQRNGINIINSQLINPEALKNLYQSADKILLDVPCSGLGVLRRNPDAKWKLNLEFIAEIKKTQAYILENYSKMLKPGGTLVYATCSILPSENEKQIANFIHNNPNEWTLIEQKSTNPYTDVCDGFYMAKLIKKNV
ncbi:MAG: RsmB/NOP family class I SAM-dependent RNA methyltransferase [Pseudarcicella sp.]|nr:RsmB/NOP family class I SAM-dependent RNA methyltransferase [Pseudarcicella sp.]MBP6409584.1 RsmB/NOP family class I SAM-dependent RNA methyltransferase [Pseudarcicella sp.]